MDRSATASESLAETVGGTSALGWTRAKVDPELAKRSIDEIPNRIFGYGSLVWRAGMTYVKRRPAEVTGFVRRFWLSSTDHRGTAENPGTYNFQNCIDTQFKFDLSS